MHPSELYMLFTVYSVGSWLYNSRLQTLPGLRSWRRSFYPQTTEFWFQLEHILNIIQKLCTANQQISMACVYVMLVCLAWTQPEAGGWHHPHRVGNPYNDPNHHPSRPLPLNSFLSMLMFCLNKKSPQLYDFTVRLNNICPVTDVYFVTTLECKQLSLLFIFVCFMIRESQI